jgi:hypothetical protein
MAAYEDERVMLDEAFRRGFEAGQVEAAKLRAADPLSVLAGEPGQIRFTVRRGHESFHPGQFESAGRSAALDGNRQGREARVEPIDETPIESASSAMRTFCVTYR